MAIDLDAIKEHVDLIIGSESMDDLAKVAESIKQHVADEPSLEFLRACWRAKREQLTNGTT